jgi:hypothetical protein
MNGSIANWVQAATGISVLIGLVLVVWELQQSRDLASAQVTADVFSSLEQERTGHYGDNFAMSLSKACFEPDQLTKAELFILDAYFSNLSSRVNRLKQEADIAGFSTDWRGISTVYIRKILSFPRGKWWLETHPFWNDETYPEVSALIKVVINNGGFGSCNTYFERFQNSIER